MTTEQTPLKHFATLKQTKLHCQIDWTIEDYLTLSELNKEGSEQFSPDFELYFPELNKTFVFALEICPKGEESEENKNQIGLFLINRRPEKVDVKADIWIGTKVFSFTHTIDGLGGYGCPSLLTQPQLRLNKNDLLPDGNLHIVCKFIIYTRSKIIGKVEKVDEEKDDLCLSMEKLLHDYALTDFDIICERKIFPCHKSILANRSDVFAAVMKSDRWQESKTNTYPIDADPRVVELMIHFIYTNRLPEGATCSTELLLIADRFNLKGLIKLCEARLAKSLTLSNAIGILDVADEVADAFSLKMDAIEFVSKNLPALIGTKDWNWVLGKNVELLNSILKTRF